MTSDHILKERFDRLAGRFDHTYLATDPVSLVHRFTDPVDIETVGLQSQSSRMAAHGRSSPAAKTCSGVWGHHLPRSPMH